MTLNSSSHDKSEIVKRSSLYQEFLAEREEVLRHKWLESERMGEDIGFEAALIDWVCNHRISWRNARNLNPSDSLKTFGGEE